MARVKDGLEDTAMIARVSENQVDAFARFLREAPDVKPFHFSSPSTLFPPGGAAGVVDYFFFCTAHQFGFWTHDARGYVRPMIASVDGVALKGSDYLSTCATRLWASRPDAFSPESLSAMTDADWSKVFADDTGANPLPMWDEHLQIIRDYTAWPGAKGVRPHDVLAQANASATPLATFLVEAGQIPGYAEDPMQKKLQLLAVILENRPEHFLRVTDPQAYRPIIDYHLQRSALRTGLVEITDDKVAGSLRDRRFVEPATECEIRRATFDAVGELVRRSGRSVAAVDYFFFTNRSKCPEMSEPVCAQCPVRSICARRTDLFQPVIRTTAY